MRIRVTISFLASALLTFPCLRVAAAPEPNLVPRTWQLEITYSTPEPIAVTDAQGQIRWYWFLPYKVVNRTGTDRQFLPKIVVATDQGDIVLANDKTPPSVFPAIKLKLRNRFVESPIEAAGVIQQGQDQARESVAIWPAFLHDVDMLSIFVTGLSGETVGVLNPKTGEPVIDPGSLKPVLDPATNEPLIDPNTGKPLVQPRPLLMRKTLMLEYHLPGSVLHPQRQQMTPQGKRWVMR